MILKLYLVVFYEVGFWEFKQVFIGKLWDFIAYRHLASNVAKNMAFVGLKLSDKDCFGQLKILDNVSDSIRVVIVKNDRLDLKVFGFLLKSFFDFLKSELSQA